MMNNDVHYFNIGLARSSLCNTGLIPAELLLTHLRYPWNKLSIYLSLYLSIYLSFYLSIYLSICVQCILDSNIFLVYLGWLTNSQTHPKFQKNISFRLRFSAKGNFDSLSHLKQVFDTKHCAMLNSMDLNISIKALWLTTT